MSRPAPRCWHRARCTLLAGLGAALLGAAAAAQPPAGQPEGEPQDPAARRAAAQRALTTWLESDLADRDLLDRAVDALIAAEDAGIELVAASLRRAEGTEDRTRRAAVDTLVSNFLLGVLQHRVDSGMVFAGQYDDLRRLQPAAGRFLLKLVIDTPDWFPADMRSLVIPALRDVFPDGPGDAVTERLAEIVEDRDFESQAMREATAYALAQWGHREYVQERIDRLRQAAGAGQTADELHFVRQLADVHYNLREYESAADHWQRYLDRKRELDDRPTTHDLYNAACCLALAGRSERALQELERCAELVGDGVVDTTSPLTREMFETDPDLRAIRDDPRFGAALRTAFPDDAEPPDDDKDGAPQ